MKEGEKLMNKRWKKGIGAIVVCAGICLFTMQSMASSFAYDTTSYSYYAKVTNDSARSRTLAVTTRPTSGTGGTRVTITNSSATPLASKTFSYYSNTGELASSVPSSTIRRIYIQPATAGQRVVGTLTYVIR